jgi:hypothetical protein
MSANRGWSQLIDATLYLEEEMECMVMGEGFHRGFTAAEKTELWDRWKRGESLKAIGRAFGKTRDTLSAVVDCTIWFGQRHETGGATHIGATKSFTVTMDFLSGTTCRADRHHRLSIRQAIGDISTDGWWRWTIRRPTRR